MYINCYHYINIHHNIPSTIITRNFEIECAKLLVKHLVRGPRYDIVLCDFMRIKGNVAAYKDLNLARASRRAINRHVTC